VGYPTKEEKSNTSRGLLDRRENPARMVWMENPDLPDKTV
jgi:hypothetical protein